MAGARGIWASMFPKAEVMGSIQIRSRKTYQLADTDNWLAVVGSITRDLVGVGDRSVPGLK